MSQLTCTCDIKFYVQLWVKVSGIPYSNLKIFFRSGTVSKEEVMAVCNKMNIAVSEEDLKEIMSKLVHVSPRHDIVFRYMYVNKMAGSELIRMVHAHLEEIILINLCV